MEYTAEKAADTITLFVYTGKDASFTLYEDENTNYNCEKGSFANIPITYSEATKTLTITSRKGSFKGMLEKRRFEIVWVTKTKAKQLDFEQKEDDIIAYNGSKALVKMKQGK